MNRNSRSLAVLNIVIILLSLVITVCGVCSFQTGHAYETVNQYGQSIKMWGAGIYAHDSFFKAPIFMGSDLTVLVVILPLAVITYRRLRTAPSVERLIGNFAVMSLLLYYSASLAFGVTYNRLHLLYIALFGMCFYFVGFLFMKLYALRCKQKAICRYRVSKGLKVYLIMAGLSLFVAWLPDIVTSLVNKTPLDLLEVYTTEITYVLDMGIISPLIFLTLYLLNRGDFIGYVLLRMILRVCMGVGIMLPVQTACQMFAGVSVPVPALVTKVLIFVLLGGFAVLFDVRLRRETEYAEG